MMQLQALPTQHASAMRTSLSNAEAMRIAKISQEVFADPDPLKLLDSGVAKAKSTALVPIGSIPNGSRYNSSSGLATSISMPAENTSSETGKRLMAAAVSTRPVIRRKSVLRVKELVKKLDEEKRKHENVAAEIAVRTKRQKDLSRLTTPFVTRSERPNFPSSSEKPNTNVLRIKKSEVATCKVMATAARSSLLNVKRT